MVVSDFRDSERQHLEGNMTERERRGKETRRDESEALILKSVLVMSVSLLLLGNNGDKLASLNQVDID